MSRSRRTLLAVFSIAVPLLIHDVVNAQCSRGGGRGGATTSPVQASPAFSSASSLFTSASLGNALANQRAYALRQQQMLAMQQRTQQQQFLALRQQQYQQLASAQYARQREIHANRLARAEEKREKRAERIAALKARRTSEIETSGIMLASDVPSTDGQSID